MPEDGYDFAVELRRERRGPLGESRELDASRITGQERVYSGDYR